MNIGEELYDAASKGDATRLQQLLQQDPYLVERVSFPCSRNLLHIATLQGQVAIVEEVLKMSPRLALELDSNGSSPLHIAAAKGDVEIAKRLLSVAPRVCWCRDSQGMNPVHVAAMEGHVEMLEELLRKDVLPAKERVHRGQTVLHLSVKKGELTGVKFLAERLDDLVHEKDDDGKTPLQWASGTWVGRSQVQSYLKDLQNIKKKRDNEIEERESRCWNWSDAKCVEYLTKKKEQTMVVMTLIATMAFQAAINPPGGVWQEDTSSHKAGEAVIAYTHPNIYRHLVGANTTAFVSSLVTIFMFIVPLPIWKSAVVVVSSYVVWVSLASIAVSYGGSVLVLAPNAQTRSLTQVINIVLSISFVFFGIMLAWIIIMVCRIIKNVEEYCFN
ncbi:ankyrin repeat-containing protein ITN1-like [Salvia divinorum]|uniref:Ankyrin repeat-containing protein ITN1-like n=1 Tax=Salvia divinorum TaxID=28513 RepID=A0ABD1HL99_SALDI